jgi:hypothetical protein
VLFGRPGNNPMCHSRVLVLAEAGLVEKLEPAGAAPGVPFDFGHYRIVEAQLGPDLELDPVIGLTLASQTFGVSPGALSLWSKQELADCLGKGLKSTRCWALQHRGLAQETPHEDFPGSQ